VTGPRGPVTSYPVPCPVSLSSPAVLSLAELIIKYEVITVLEDGDDGGETRRHHLVRTEDRLMDQNWPFRPVPSKSSNYA